MGTEADGWGASGCGCCSELTEPLSSALLALLAALLLGAAASVQQSAARRQSARRPLSPRLVRDLLRERAWVAAVAVMVAGYGAQAAALGLGRLTVVEPLVSCYLVVALLLAAARARRRPPPQVVAAAAACCGGVALFLNGTASSAGAASAPSPEWAEVLGALLVLVTAAAAVATRLAPVGRAQLLGVVGGICLGTSDALTKQTVTVLGQQHLGALASWTPYALVAVGALAFLVQQSAYHSGPLQAALPPLSILEPVVGTGLGLTLFSEIPGPGVSPAALGVGLLLMVGGLAVLARAEGRAADGIRLAT